MAATGWFWPRFLFPLSILAGVYGVEVARPKGVKYNGPFPYLPVEGRDIIEVAKVCRRLAEPKARLFRSSQICIGEVTDRPENRNKGLNNPFQCLRDQMPDIWAKMCQLCSVEMLDGVISVSTDRGEGRCAARFQALQRISQAVLWTDPNVVKEMKKASYTMERLSLKFKTWEEGSKDALKHLGSSSMPFSDLSGNGWVDKEELLAFLQAVFVVSEVSNVAVVVGDRTPTELAAFASYDLVNWLRFYDARPVTTAEGKTQLQKKPLQRPSL